MLALIDESGDCGLKFGGGSSDYFTCVVVVFTGNVQADACDRSVNALRLRLKRPPGYEFHFTHCSDNVRQEFLETVSREDFQYAGFVINKRKLYDNDFHDPKQLYEFAVRLACERVRPLLKDAKIIIDENGKRAFRQDLAKKLKAQMTGADGKCCIRKVTMEASHSNNLLQVADMICGAVNRSFTAKDQCFRKMIRQRENFVHEWPL